MSYPTMPLKDLLALHDSGVWGAEDQSDGISVLRSTNFKPDGSICFESLTYRHIDLSKRRNKILLPNDIILEKSGGGPNQPVGRVCLFRGHQFEHTFGNFTARLRADRSIADPEYLFWVLRNFHLSGGTLKYQKYTSGIRNLETKRYFSHPIPLPPLNEQRRIVNILNRAAKIERLQKQAQERLQEFIPALFVKMFGDPVENPMGWAKRKIGEVCRKTGQRNPSKEPNKEFLYVDIAGIDNVQKKIDNFHVLLGENAPSRARKKIRQDDVVLSSVRPNLNAVAMVPEVLDGEIASTGLCVLRADRKLLEPCYLFSCMTSAHFVETVASKVRGANYPAVSDRDIRNIEIILPPLKDQRQFSDIVNAVQSTIKLLESGSLASTSLTASLMSRLLESGP